MGITREDIEKAGFTFRAHSVDDWYELREYIDDPISYYSNSGFSLRHDYRTGTGVRIVAYEYTYQLEEDKEGENLFKGNVQNPEEFQTVLKQIGII